MGQEDETARYNTSHRDAEHSRKKARMVVDAPDGCRRQSHGGRLEREAIATWTAPRRASVACDGRWPSGACAGLFTHVVQPHDSTFLGGRATKAYIEMFHWLGCSCICSHKASGGVESGRLLKSLTPSPAQPSSFLHSARGNLVHEGN